MLDIIVSIQLALSSAAYRIREEGATSVEYGLLLGLMTLALIVGATQFSHTVNKSYNNITDSIASVLPGT